MSSFYFIAIIGVLYVNGVFGKSRGEPLTTKSFTVNSEANTYVITTTRKAVEKLPSLAQEAVLDEHKLFEDPEVKGRIQQEREHFEARKEKHQGFVDQCQRQKFIKIRDELGCELCTCIYEKSMMFCSPYECQPQDDRSLTEQIGQSLYNDYIIHVDTNFSEYNCTPGEILMLSALCDCACVAQDILSCPSTCHYGRKLY